jgi:Rod binding domain-containing protein
MIPAVGARQTLSLLATGPKPVAEATTDTKTDPKLKKAASDFESILVTSWLEKMRDAFSLDGKSEDAMPGGDSMTALATQAVAQAMAARGGFGIGKMLYDRMRPH